MSDNKSKRRIVAVRFVNSIPFNNESISVHISNVNGIGTADSILPSRLVSDGTPKLLEGNDRADGLLVTRSYHDRVRNTSMTEAVFVPMANVKGIVYGD